MKHLSNYTPTSIGGSRPQVKAHFSRRLSARILAVVSAVVVPLSWALAQNASGPMVSPKSVPNGQAGLQNGNPVYGSQLGPVPGQGTSSGMSSGPLDTTAPTTSSSAPPGFVPPVNSVTPMQQNPIQFPGQVNPPATTAPAPGSGLNGTNNSVNTSPFAPSLQGAGSLGASPQIGTGSPPLGTSTGTPMTPPANH